MWVGVACGGQSALFRLLRCQIHYFLSISFLVGLMNLLAMPLKRGLKTVLVLGLASYVARSMPQSESPSKMGPGYSTSGLVSYSGFPDALTKSLSAGSSLEVPWSLPAYPISSPHSLVLFPSCSSTGKAGSTCGALHDRSLCLGLFSQRARTGAPGKSLEERLPRPLRLKDSTLAMPLSSSAAFPFLLALSMH